MKTVCVISASFEVCTYRIGEIDRNWRLILVLGLSLTEISFPHLFNELLLTVENSMTLFVTSLETTLQ